ncbi:hypothetical protein AB0O15_48015, partial [Actinoplanes sp. NPDC089786]
MRASPEEIPDEEYEQVLERVAAVDVAKDSGMVCTRLPSGAGVRRISRVWQVPATNNAVSDLAAQLVELGIEKVWVPPVSTERWLPASGRGRGEVIWLGVGVPG